MGASTSSVSRRPNSTRQGIASPSAVASVMAHPPRQGPGRRPLARQPSARQLRRQLRKEAHRLLHGISHLRVAQPRGIAKSRSRGPRTGPAGKGRCAQGPICSGPTSAIPTDESGHWTAQRARCASSGSRLRSALRQLDQAGQVAKREIHAIVDRRRIAVRAGDGQRPGHGLLIRIAKRHELAGLIKHRSCPAGRRQAERWGGGEWPAIPAGTPARTPRAPRRPPAVPCRKSRQAGEREPGRLGTGDSETLTESPA